MAATFVVVPEWQGSVSARAMRLIDGAEAIRGDLPSAATRTVDVPTGAGEALETGVRRFSALLHIRQNLTETLAGLTGQVVLIGGDCGVSVAAIDRVAADDLAVVWFDAHPDLNSAEDSPSGAFGGMTLRAVLGEAPDGLASTAPVPAARVVLAGTRAVDPQEQRLITERGIRVVTVEQLAVANVLADAVAATGASRVYLHVDLDVLDPSAISGLDYPLPFGVTVDQLTAAIGAVRERTPIVGATIAGFSPASPAAGGDDLPAILRIIGAITRG